MFILLCAPSIVRPSPQTELDTLAKQLQNKQLNEAQKLKLLEEQLSKFPTFKAFEQAARKLNEPSTSLFLKTQIVFDAQLKNFPKLLKDGHALLELKNCNRQDSLFAYYALAAYFQKGGYFNYALNYYQKLHKLYELHTNFKQKLRLSHQIGLVHFSQKNYPDAVSWFKKTLIDYEEGENFLFPFQVMNNLGLAYEQIGELDSALYYFKKVTTYLSNDLSDSLINDREVFFEGLVKGNQGVVYLKKRDTVKGIALLKEDMMISDSTAHYLSACNARIMLSRVYLAKKDLETVNRYLSKALELSLTQGFTEQRRVCYRLLAIYYQQKGDYKNSSTYYSRFMLLNDSLSKAMKKQQDLDFALELDLITQDNEISLLKMEAKQKGIEIESKRWQLTFAIGLSILLILTLTIVLVNGRIKSKLNESLLQKNQEIRKRGVQLENAVLEKDIMLKEMHHRVKNNLQLVQSLLRLQAADINDPTVHRAYEESINRLSSMSLIHQNLYTQEKYKSIEFKAYLESLLEFLKDVFKNEQKQISINLSSTEFDLSIDQAIPCGLIITELVSNAFQHAFTKQNEGQINLHIQKKGKHFVFEIFDNGKGLKPDFNMQNMGFGSSMVKMLVDQIDGDIKFENRDGAYFCITFKDLLA